MTSYKGLQHFVYFRFPHSLDFAFLLSKLEQTLRAKGKSSKFIWIQAIHTLMIQLGRGSLLGMPDKRQNQLPI